MSTFIKSISPRVAAESDSSIYLGIIDKNEFVMRKDSSYYYQVQGQMAITGTKCRCGFIVYTFNIIMFIFTVRVRF